MDYKGWHPRPVKFEPPSKEDLTSFLEAVENNSTLSASSKWWWNYYGSQDHNTRCKEAFEYCLEMLYLNKVINPEHITGLLPQIFITQFNRLVEHQFSKEHIKTACHIMCLRERYMFACAFHKSFQIETGIQNV